MKEQHQLTASRDEGLIEPESPRNRTPLFRLAAALPEFAAEVRRILEHCGEHALAEQVETLWVFDRCRCGEEDCATVYTDADERPASTHRGIGAHLPNGDYMLIEVDDERIISIEAFSAKFAMILREVLP